MTKVIFRKFSDGDVIALFPEIVGDMNPYSCQSYMHIGQHGTASMDLIQDTKPAAPEEYAQLLDELKMRGYTDLKVVKRFRYADLEERKRQIQEWEHS